VAMLKRRLLALRVHGVRSSSTPAESSPVTLQWYDWSSIVTSSLLQPFPDGCRVAGNLNRAQCTPQTFDVERLGQTWVKRMLSREWGSRRIPRLSRVCSSVAKIPERERTRVEHQDTMYKDCSLIFHHLLPLCLTPYYAILWKAETLRVIRERERVVLVVVEVHVRI
jgi:hypothetical protein